MRVLARVTNLLRGWASQWVGRTERRNPAAIYESAIQERLNQYQKLRESAAGVLYVRSKLADQLGAESRELERLGAQLEIAIDRNDDPAALTLLGSRDTAAAEVKRLTKELLELTKEAETAKRNLVSFQGEISRLREEKVRMMARLANAKVRIRLRETLSGLSPEADIQALESVRDHIQRLVTEAEIQRELKDGELEKRLAKIRETEATASARAQLDELKRSKRRALVPIVLPGSAMSRTKQTKPAATALD